MNILSSKDLDKFTIKDLWSLYSIVIMKLKEKGGIRTGNITGERGEGLVIDFFNDTPGLPNLQVAPKNTQNIDAISIEGKRYSIKTVKLPNKTSGVFYGMGTPENPINDKKFEFVELVVINDGYELEKIIELEWDVFYKLKSWHSRMNAFNLLISKNLLDNSKIIFDRSSL